MPTRETTIAAATAARALRKGLDAESAAAAVPHLRELTGAAGVALYDTDATLLAHDGSIWTTAPVTLTDAGTRYLENARRITAAVADAEASLKALKA